MSCFEKRTRILWSTVYSVALNMALKDWEGKSCSQVALGLGLIGVPHEGQKLSVGDTRWLHDEQ